MTLITLQDGKIVLRDGKVGTEQACCCEPCTPAALTSPLFSLQALLDVGPDAAVGLGPGLTTLPLQLIWASDCCDGDITITIRITTDGDPSGSFFPADPSGPQADLVFSAVGDFTFDPTFQSLPSSGAYDFAFAFDDNDLVITVTGAGTQAAQDFTLTTSARTITGASIEAVCNPLP
jgi:hypothetical protein